MQNHKPKIVVLGAGYAGMITTRRLVKKLGPEEAEITLVNKHNYHHITTWLHEVAAGTMSQNQARIMISDIISEKRVSLVYDTVQKVNKEEKQVILDNGVLEYDYLVFALGFEKATFGIPGLDEHSFSISSIDSSREIYHHIEYQFATYRSENENSGKLNIIVGGSGFTGIEFLGELADSIPKLCKKFDIDRRKVRIINVEMAPTILPGFDEELIDYTKNNLKIRGIEFLTNTKIEECSSDGIKIAGNQEIKAGTIVWTGGVQGSSVLTASNFNVFKGKVNVNDDLRMPEDENIFVLGDCAWVTNKELNKPYPPTAQIATQEAETCAENLKFLIRGETRLKEFNFSDKGVVVSLGGGDACGTIFSNTKLYGKTARAMKNVIDNRYLLMLGGPALVLKKGKFTMF
ncbi:NAD(P)/FAD-dependent oxidoreductase [Alkalicoccus daliensis]|uniref:NADH dehydrogenase n=1 Tax=Alkalicoccus daliensis TaxID=745820 RepID=A0A1H0HRC7_9BACI|nr:NAD(P)/FAD-dependent oxidoreductase [Alkalicoccus daliensis]SDO21687.1 NADH dehydrogenase [Alkalicoccus daliensis]